MCHTTVLPTVLLGDFYHIKIEHDSQCTYLYVQRNNEVGWYNHSCCRKEKCITYYECVFVAWVIEYVMRMRHIVMSPLRLYSIFPHYLINDTIFGKKLLNTKCVFWFSVHLLSETFLILRRIQRDIIKNVYRLSCKVPVIAAGLWWNLNYLYRFSKKYSNIKFYEKL